MESKEKSVINIHEIYIKAPPNDLGRNHLARMDASATGIAGSMNLIMRPGGQFRVKANEGMRSPGLPETIIDGEVIECSPPTQAGPDVSLPVRGSATQGRLFTHHLRD